MSEKRKFFTFDELKVVVKVLGLGPNTLLWHADQNDARTVSIGI